MANDETSESKERIVEVAWRYIKRGWPVLPIHGVDSAGRCNCGDPNCRSPGKHPSISGGLNSATTDFDEVQRFLKSGSNLAVRTGDVSGLVVVDVDKKSGGFESLADLQNRYGELPATITARTGGGGLHFYFKHPGGGTIKNSAGKVAPGIDVRGDGGYVLVDPSMHLSGRRYEWLEGHGPSEIEPAVPPEWLLKRIQGAVSVHEKGSGLAHGATVEEGSRNDHLACVAGKLRRSGLEESEIEPALQEYNRNRCDPPLDPEEVEAIARSIGRYTNDTLDPKAPDAIAGRLLDERFKHPDRHTLLYTDGSFLRWKLTHWQKLRDYELRSEVYSFLRTKKRFTKERGEMPFDPTSTIVSNVIDAMQARVAVPTPARYPMVMGRDVQSQDLNIVACKNGLLVLPEREIWPHSPSFLNLNCLPFEYAPGAPVPRRWLSFLDQIFDGDAQSIESLQQVFGCAISSDRSFQKLILLVGPPRSGKGTSMDVLTELVGAENVASPSLSDLESRFGLAPLIDKQLAIVPDARLDDRAKQTAIVEKLLSISGQDKVTADRKYKEPWTGRLSALFVVATNQVPSLGDPSGALASRIVSIRTINSFLGNEDRTLRETLRGELSGILNWALDGAEQLQRQGHFTQPSIAKQDVDSFRELSAPIMGFVSDCCEIAADHRIRKDVLYREWREYAIERGHAAGSNAEFSRNLRAAVSTIGEHRPASDSNGERPRFFRGIGLKPEAPVVQLVSAARVQAVQGTEDSKHIDWSTGPGGGE